MADGNRRYKSEKKDYKISFKLSESELIKLESDAKKAGKNRSEYLRELVKNSKPAPPACRAWAASSAGTATAASAR